MLKEEADGIVRVSLRSLGDVDVCRIAADHGGGGHRFAAGLRVDRSTSRRSSRGSATRSDRARREQPGAMSDGLVVVDKPAGCTSHDVVAKLRKVYGQRRVGHAGTLDPDATGVLLVGLGRATRLLRFLQEAGKAYRGRDRVRHRDEHPRRGGRDRRPAARCR